jgi:hypothetical protein
VLTAQGWPVSGNTPDPLVDAAGRLFDTVEGELFTTAQDLAAREPALATWARSSPPWWSGWGSGPAARG